MFVPVSQEIKERVTMRDVCEKYGIQVNRSGMVVCVFHGDKNASMKIYPKHFYCYACHAHGTVLDFVMMYFSLSYKAAVSKLNDDFSLGLKLNKQLSSDEREKLNRNTALRKKARSMAEARLKALETAYNEAEMKVAQLHSTINRSNPRAVQGGLITQEYADAVRMLPFAEYNAEQAEAELYSALHIGEKIR